MPIMRIAVDRLIANHRIFDTLDLRAEFGNDNPVELDIGCGTGRFLIARARAHPELNLLGIERLLGRVRTVLAKAERHGLDNVRLLRLEAAYALDRMLPDAGLATVYIAFPDPWPKRRHHRRRLIQPTTVANLYRVLRPGGTLHVATDHADYYEQVCRLVEGHADWLPTAPYLPTPEETSSFERLWCAQGRPIYRCAWQRGQTADRGP